METYVTSADDAVHIPGGEDILVTMANRIEYVDAYVDLPLGPAAA